MTDVFLPVNFFAAVRESSFNMTRRGGGGRRGRGMKILKLEA